jgi:tetratricopeptide (TPR) repeat protein
MRVMNMSNKRATNMIKNVNQNVDMKRTFSIAIILTLIPVLLLSLLSLPSSFLPYAYSQAALKDSKGITWYDKALAINQNNVPALVQKGTALVNEGNGYQAITWLDKALTIDPTNMMALVSKGAALQELGQYRDAIVMYDRVLAIDPTDVYALGGKAASLYGSGQYQQAVTWIDKVFEVDPNDGKILQVKQTLEETTN